MFSLPRFVVPALVGAIVAAVPALAEIQVKSGEKIAFLGDSITQQGWQRNDGYVKLVMAGLEANGIKAEAAPAGIGGHKSNQMLQRLEADVLSKKPQWMTLSCGVNDVWHGPMGVPLDDAMAAANKYEARPGDTAPKGTYQKNISALLEKVVAAGVKPVVLTATVIHENLESPENAKLAPYNAWLRSYAAEKKIPVADLYAACAEAIKAGDGSGRYLTYDGVHMDRRGNELMAAGVLKALGADDGELAKAKEAWAKIPVTEIKKKP